MSKPTILIVGGGLAGLSAGIYALASGYEVHLFEHHSQPGGVCTAWERDGFTFDGCIHWLLGATPGHAFRQIYEEVGALTDLRLLPVDHYARILHEPSGTRIDITRDLDRFVADARGWHPEDGERIAELVAAARSLRGFEMPLDLGPFEQLTWLAEHWRQLRVFGQFSRSLEETAEGLHHPLLRLAVRRLFNPKVGLPFALMVLSELEAGQLAVPEGGSGVFSENVARRFRMLGGQLHLNADVTEILVEQDRAVGVRLADGAEWRADRVISAASGYATIFRMLHGAYTSKGIRARYAEWDVFDGMLVASFGVDRPWPGQPPQLEVHLEHPVRVGLSDVDELQVRTFSHDPTLAPEGKGVVQVMIPADFDYWSDLHHDNAAYALAKERLAADLLAALEPVLPGIGQAVLTTDVATPYTFWRFTRAWRGSYEGWMPTAERMSARMENTLPGLEGFHMCGQWTQPIAGVPTSLASGREVVKAICELDERAFRVPPRVGPAHERPA